MHSDGPAPGRTYDRAMPSVSDGPVAHAEPSERSHQAGQAVAAVQKFVDQAKETVLLLHDGGAVADAVHGDRVQRCGLTEPVVVRGRHSVVLAVADVAALRRAASMLPELGRAKAIMCWLAEAEQPLAIVPRPEWPALSSCSGRSFGAGEAALTVLRFRAPVAVSAVVAELARSAVPARVAGTDGLRVTSRAPRLEAAPPVDPVFATSPGTDADVPPDLVLGPGPAAHTSHEVLGRPPASVSEPDLLLGPLDEAVLNPVGFITTPSLGAIDLREYAAGGPSPEQVRRLREHAAVHVDWSRAGSVETARTVAGLAMAGVPLVSGPLPSGAERLLGAPLAAELVASPDLTDLLHREEHSVGLRRAALLHHSTLGWRTRLAAAAHVPFRPFPSCSVVMATRRPRQLEFALRQVSRQRGVTLQLVLAAHGFVPDPTLVRSLAGDDVVVVPLPAETIFGDVLSAGVAAADGELVVKMDDDDWYGPHFVLDLLLARRYSSAEIVGSPAEFAYLETLDRTVRRKDTTEHYGRFVAGGTLLLDRSTLHSLGGFRPVRRYVDAQLLSAAHAAGARVYRMSGLGYLLRRSEEGHTWHQGTDYFLHPERVRRTWDGFVPSRVLEHEPDEPDEPRGSDHAAGVRVPRRWRRR
jgi:hypothetical protein